MSVAAACAVAAIALQACGSDSEDEEKPGPRYITGAQIRDEATSGSPERVALEWWRAVQFGNTTGVVTYYDPALGIDLDALNEQLAVASSAFAGVPSIESVQEAGDTATVFIVVDPPDPDVAERTVSVDLKRPDNDWVLADNLLLEQTVERVERARDSAGPSGSG